MFDKCRFTKFTHGLIFFLWPKVIVWVMYLPFLLLNWLSIKRNLWEPPTYYDTSIILFTFHSYLYRSPCKACFLCPFIRGHLSGKWNNPCYLFILFSFLACTLHRSCARILHREWVALGKKQYCIFIRMLLHPVMEPPYGQTLCNGPGPCGHRQHSIFVEINGSATQSRAVVHFGRSNALAIFSCGWLFVFDPATKLSRGNGMHLLGGSDAFRIVT